LGAAWLVLKTEGDLRSWAYRRLDLLVPAIAAILIALFAFALARHLRVFDRWRDDPRLFALPALGVMAMAALWFGVRWRRDGVPFPDGNARGCLRLRIARRQLLALHDPLLGHAARGGRSGPVLEFLFWGAGILVLLVVLI
jgi:cytochrome d ubiquinol oxidase subunit II